MANNAQAGAKDTLPTMLWFDRSVNEFSERVLRAATFYKQKYGEWPNLCFVNTDVYNGLAGGAQDAEVTVAGIAVKGDKYVRPYDFHIGFMEEVKG